MIIVFKKFGDVFRGVLYYLVKINGLLEIIVQVEGSKREFQLESSLEQGDSVEELYSSLIIIYRIIKFQVVLMFI